MKINIINHNKQFINNNYICMSRQQQQQQMTNDNHIIQLNICLNKL